MVTGGVALLLSLVFVSAIGSMTDDFQEPPTNYESTDEVVNSPYIEVVNPSQNEIYGYDNLSEYPLDYKVRVDTSKLVNETDVDRYTFDMLTGRQNDFVLVEYEEERSPYNEDRAGYGEFYIIGSMDAPMSYGESYTSNAFNVTWNEETGKHLVEFDSEVIMADAASLKGQTVQQEFDWKDGYFSHTVNLIPDNESVTLGNNVQETKYQLREEGDYTGNFLLLNSGLLTGLFMLLVLGSFSAAIMREVG